MSILITGTGTLVGNTLAHKLLSSKNVIYATYYKSYPKDLYNKKNIKLHKMNIENPMLKNNNITTIIHCASAIPDYQFRNKKVDLCGKIILINILRVFLKILLIMMIIIILITKY